MNFGFRRRLLLSSLAVIMVVGLGVGLFLEVQLRSELHERFVAELTRHARAMGETIDGMAEDQTEPEEVRAVLDPVADRLGTAMEARISVIGPQGALVADSQVGLHALKEAEDHSTRAEVVAARLGNIGTAQRRSVTVGADMLYVALRVNDRSHRVVRASLPLSQIDEAVRELRIILLLAGLVAIAGAVLLAALASRLFSRSLRRLVETAQHEAGAVPEATDDDDEPASVNSIAYDLRRTVRLLGAERERFEAVLETMGQAVLGLDAQRRLDTVNRAARELLSLPDAVIGRSLLDYVRVPALQELLDRVEPGAPATIEFDYGVRPRRRLFAQATISRQGKGTVVVMRDVTELRRLETIRKDFVANVSHELRTPVAVIQANAETLLAGAINDPERATVFLNALARHADRMGRLVADLLDISRIEAGRYDLEIGPIDLVEMVDRTIVALASQAEDREMVVKNALEGEHWVASDDEALEQVLVNLISNAIKYTQKGGRVVVDAVVLERLDDGTPARLKIEVRDDGPGIDLRHHRRVFERFYRVDSGRARQQGGTGLGLAIVKHLIEAMDGQVGVDANRPRGSVFWFTAPTAAGAFDAGDEDEYEDDELSQPSIVPPAS
ncbi:MAG: ATP-binding protein [Myxococcota bacterium]